MRAAESKDAGVTLDQVLRQTAGPIIDICVVKGKAKAPDGYYKVHKSIGNNDGSLNANSPGDSLYLCVKRSSRWIKETAENEKEELPIVDLAVITTDIENVPDGYQLVYLVPEGVRADFFVCDLFSFRSRFAEAEGACACQLQFWLRWKSFEPRLQTIAASSRGTLHSKSISQHHLSSLMLSLGQG
jgi:hypothetical protein